MTMNKISEGADGCQRRCSIALERINYFLPHNKKHTTKTNVNRFLYITNHDSGMSLLQGKCQLLILWRPNCQIFSPRGVRCQRAVLYTSWKMTFVAFLPQWEYQLYASVMQYKKSSGFCNSKKLRSFTFQSKKAFIFTFRITFCLKIQAVRMFYFQTDSILYLQTDFMFNIKMTLYLKLRLTARFTFWLAPC